MFKIRAGYFSEVTRFSLDFIDFFLDRIFFLFSQICIPLRSYSRIRDREKARKNRHTTIYIYRLSGNNRIHIYNICVMYIKVIPNRNFSIFIQFSISILFMFMNSRGFLEDRGFIYIRIEIPLCTSNKQ